MKKQLVIFVIIGACFLLSGYCFYVYFTTEQKCARVCAITKKTESIVSEALESALTPTSTKKKDLIASLREEYQNKDIIGYMELGRIKEPIVYSATDDGYISRDLDKKYSEFGTIFLYKENTSIFDPVITLFGHNVVGHDTKFSRLANYESHQNELKTLRLHTENGLFIYEEQVVVVLDGLVYDKYNTWSYSGLSAFVNDLPDIGTVLYDSTNTLDSNAKYVVLSTCRDPKGVNVVVAIYKLVA